MISEPAHDCGKCPRLAEFRRQARLAEPTWFNAPVPTFGSPQARLLIVGLAPGLRGANRTGRPFTGDYAGDLLYETLQGESFARGTYGREAGDGLVLIDCAITNAVRCVPPRNKPLPIEIGTCRSFLVAQIEAMPNLLAIVTLGRIAHDSVVRALGMKLSAAPFAHGRRHEIARRNKSLLALYDSYHCSRYNTNTGVLTSAMFKAVFASVRADLAGSAGQ